VRARYTVDDFDYALPAELIAQHPARDRAGSRLLHVEGEQLTDLRFTDLPRCLAAGDLLVFNDTRVINARLRGRKPTGGDVELFIERLDGPASAVVQMRASHPPRIGMAIRLAGAATAIVESRTDRLYAIRFEGTGPLDEWLERHGELPLPPYITHSPDASDADRYQTIYARDPGAVAAPTAGLHFDASMLEALQASGVARAFVTLHVGSGTFAPVTVTDITDHRMHAERYSIPQATVDAIATARARRGRVVAVGTTSLRALEASAASGGIRAGADETSLFITPGYRFRIVDRLLTNFHMPRSTLLMLVTAFGGLQALRAAYAHAIRARYRFMSYGDAMLVERQPQESPPG
jgi:S-adenosylmethionine:tRNA ribosyltransferase-isomerase